LTQRTSLHNITHSTYNISMNVNSNCHRNDRVESIREENGRVLSEKNRFDCLSQSDSANMANFD